MANAYPSLSRKRKKEKIVGEKKEQIPTLALWEKF